MNAMTEPLLFKQTVAGEERELGLEPDWLGAEVTSEHRYYNNALASHPYARWTA